MQQNLQHRNCERPCSEDFRAAMKAVKIGNYGLLELEEKQSFQCRDIVTSDISY